jgi:membrane-bound lytic murein transglycosylase D
MMNSIAPFDIKVNDFVDERRDFQKSTDGALRKLEDNYRALGDWALALAAYNAGYGAVNRTIQKTKIRDYWELCEKNELRTETIHYVPKLLAVSYIISQPRRFGLDYWPQAFKSDTIILQRQVALDTLADEAGVNRELLRRLNAELLHGITPPGKSHKLKVPRTHLAYINQVLETENLALLAYQRHIVKHGDTLWSLSRYYNVHIDMITENNPGIADRYLQIGEILTIPSDRELQPPAVRHTETQTFLGTYTVKKGDTLWSLARTYETDPQTLAEANGMELNQILPEGKTLKVPIIER